MAQNTPNQQLYDLLVSKNFDLETKDGRTGSSPVNDNGQPDNSKATEFKFDYVSQAGKNYGTVIIFISGSDITLMFGDNVGKTMEGADKDEWFNFMYQIKQLATKNRLNFQPENISKEKYVQQSQAAITESWQGKGAISWNGAPTEARLIIKHKRSIDEGEARFRYIESIFVETAEGERYKLKSRSLTAGKAMLEHVRNGGKPYDVRGQHINEIVEELSVLSRFRRANSGKILEGDTKNLVEQTDAYYKNMHSVLKHLGTNRGYNSYFESWTPGEVDGGNLVVEDLKQLFVEQTIDHRIEEALPLLARITKESNTMKEAQIFESWINNLVEGTWAVPETPDARQKLVDLLSKDFPVGADAINATEQLYDILGDDELFDRLHELADADANADARSVIIARMQEMSEHPDILAVLDQIQLDEPAGEPAPEPAEVDQEVNAEQPPQEVDEGWKDVATLAGVPVVAGALAVGAQHYDDQQPHVQIGDKSVRYIAQPGWGQVPNDAMTIKGKDGKEYRVWKTSGKGSGHVWLAAPAEQQVKEGECNMTAENDYCPQHGLAECGTVAGGIAPLEEYTGNWTNFGLEESDQLTQLKRLALGK